MEGRCSGNGGNLQSNSHCLVILLIGRKTGTNLYANRYQKPQPSARCERKTLKSTTCVSWSIRFHAPVSTEQMNRGEPPVRGHLFGRSYSNVSNKNLNSISAWRRESSRRCGWRWRRPPLRHIFGKFNGTMRYIF